MTGGRESLKSEDNGSAHTVLIFRLLYRSGELKPNLITQNTHKRDCSECPSP